jgi:DNA-binding transcriptional ArsR family regulator
MGAPISLDHPQRDRVPGAQGINNRGNRMDPNQLQESAQEAAHLLKALGNRHRLSILCLLLDGEKSVGQLVHLIGLSPSALSQHLARLRHDGLVRTRRSAQVIYYTLEGAQARALLETLHGLYCCGGEPAERKPSSLGAAATIPSQLPV